MNDFQTSSPRPGFRSGPILAVAGAIAAAAIVAAVAFGGGRGGDGGAAVPTGSPTTAAPSEAPSIAPTQAPTVAPSQEPAVEPTVAPSDAPTAEPEPGTDAMPITVELVNATNASVRVDIVDGTGMLMSAESGTPGDGVSVESYTLAVENVDERTLKLTWSDYPIDNALALYIDNVDGGLRLLMVQPAPTGETDAIAFDRELVLSFSEPISADQVETFLQEGLDTPG